VLLSAKSEIERDEWCDAFQEVQENALENTLNKTG